jgi:ATP-binding cassette subfamily C protein
MTHQSYLLLTFAALSYAGAQGAKFAVGLRRKFINALLGARWAFYANQSAGHFATALGNDATRSGQAYMTAAHMFSQLVQAVALVLVSIVMDWRLAITAFVVGLVIAILFSNLILAARRAAAAQNKQMQKLASLVVDISGNIKALKSMARYEKLLDSMGDMLTSMRRKLVSQELAVNGVTQGGELVVSLLVGIGVYVANRVWHMALPELVVSAVVFYQILTATSRLQKYLQQAFLYENSYLRLTRLIATAAGEREHEGGSVIPDPGLGIRLEDVIFARRNNRIIRNATITIPANKITVLQGPSGAGKTTIIDLITGLHRPKAGRVLIGETPIEEVNLAAWRRQIGYVPQELNLLHMTVRENITLADPAITDDDVRAVLEQVGAAEFLRDSERTLDSSVGEMGVKLSGGQRQRIALARALVTRPKVLILDEVTSALDPETERQIVENIVGLRNRYTIIVITHREAWTEIADCLYQIDKGQPRLLPAPGQATAPKAAATRKKAAPRTRKASTRKARPPVSRKAAR